MMAFGMFKTTTFEADAQQPDSEVTPNRGLVLRDGFMTISPALAQQILRDATFDGQRETDPTFVTIHAENMRRGLWLAGSQIALCVCGGRYYLVNGKHRLTAVVEVGVPVEFSIVLYGCKNEAQVRAIYTRFDSNQRTRTNNQIVDAFGLCEKMGVGPAIANAVYRATPLLCNSLKPIYARHEPSNQVRIDMGVLDVRLESASSWKKEARLFEKAIDGAMARHRTRLLNGPVVAVALMTIRHAEDKALPFWKGVADDDGLRRGDPRHAFVTALKAGANRQAGLVAAAAAWNAWFKGSKLTHAKTSTTSETFCLLGTPLDGRRR